MELSLSAARRLAIRCQGLDGGWQLPAGKEGVARTVERLGYVQIDTISVVQRAHHHTLWSRRADYAPFMLHELQATDRRAFEYWAPSASYVPIRDYRYYLPRMQAYAHSPRTRQWIEANAEVMRGVLDRIRDEGPLGSADFEAPEGFKRGNWWSWKPAKRALETLFSMGELMVTERRNFQRLYDLRDRVLPANTDKTEPDEDELARFLVLRTLSAHGVVSTAEIHGRRGGASDGAITGAIDELIGSGVVTPVNIEGLEDAAYFALTESLEESIDRRQGRMLHILSPFDNLVIRRPRLKSLFEFEFALECYQPAAKRRYGYFCLPVLWGEEFVGRMDSKADRGERTLIVRQIIFEPGVEDYDGLLPSLAEKLWAFAAFNGCERVTTERVVPEKARAPLEQQLEILANRGQ